MCKEYPHRFHFRNRCRRHRDHDHHLPGALRPRLLHHFRFRGHVHRLRDAHLHLYHPHLRDHRRFHDHGRHLHDVLHLRLCHHLHFRDHAHLHHNDHHRRDLGKIILDIHTRRDTLVRDLVQCNQN